MDEAETIKFQQQEARIKELEEAYVNLQFLSDQVRFNSVIYQGFTLIIEKLAKIEEKINIGK